eukprot:g3295.t1
MWPKYKKKTRDCQIALVMNDDIDEKFHMTQRHVLTGPMAKKTAGYFIKVFILDYNERRRKHLSPSDFFLADAETHERLRNSAVLCGSGWEGKEQQYSVLPKGLGELKSKSYWWPTIDNGNYTLHRQIFRERLQLGYLNNVYIADRPIATAKASLLAHCAHFCVEDAKGNVSKDKIIEVDYETSDWPGFLTYSGHLSVDSRGNFKRGRKHGSCVVHSAWYDLYKHFAQGKFVVVRNFPISSVDGSATSKKAVRAVSELYVLLRLLCGTIAKLGCSESK